MVNYFRDINRYVILLHVRRNSYNIHEHIFFIIFIFNTMSSCIWKEYYDTLTVTDIIATYIFTEPTQLGCLGNQRECRDSSLCSYSNAQMPCLWRCYRISDEPCVCAHSALGETTWCSQLPHFTLMYRYLPTQPLLHSGDHILLIRINS